MFDQSLFEDRRKKLLELMLPNSIAVIPTAPVSNYSNDTDYKFRPDSNFHYVTGFREPGSVAILSTVEDAVPFTLFVRPRDPAMETWNGRRAGVEGAREIYQAGESFDIAEFDEKFPAYLENISAIYHFPGKYRQYDIKVFDAWQVARRKWRTGIETPHELFDLGHLMHEMRLFKSEEDLILMRQACAITCEGLEMAMRSVQPGMNERELEALIDHYYRASGANGPGFPTIVASGINSVILHYIENECTIGENDLILIDTGCEYEMHNADVTRTFPSGGKFTPEQKSIYDIVLKAQLEATKLCTTENSSEDVHQTAVKIMVDGLIGLSLLEGPLDKAIEEETYKKFYMHRTGHWLGVDVHDVGASMKNGKWRKFEPGMVITVEPGLYLAEDEESIPEAFRGIGVRIEDDILITDGNPENLTESCPKDPSVLEEIIGK